MVRIRTNEVITLEKNSIMYDFKDFNCELFKKINARLKELDIDTSPLHGRILHYLEETSGDVCQKDIETILNRNKSTTSEVLDTMEKNKLIRREVATDSRKKNIIITDKGRKEVEVVEKDREFVEQALLDGISDEEYQQFRRFLNKVKRNLERI